MNDARYYSVRHFRSGDNEVVWVGDDLGNPNVGPWGLGFRREISLKWRWWQNTSPAERLRNALEKAQKKADEWNEREMYLNHEREIGVKR